VIIHTPGRVSYEVGLELQEAARDRVLSGGSDELLLLEHEPVVTLGRRGGVIDRDALDRLHTPVIETDRGGLATWHGPGQLVGYPIVNLHRRSMKVPRFVGILGAVIEDALASLGLHGAAYDCARPGVYIDGRKLAAIGLHIQHRVSTHGFALNVHNELRGFEAIVPCGLSGVRVSTLSRELGREVELRPALEAMRQGLVEALDPDGPSTGSRGSTAAQTPPPHTGSPT
jgi:lipoyl(octanoyl) transferase